jgi:hypothetical protein
VPRKEDGQQSGPAAAVVWVCTCRTGNTANGARRTERLEARPCRRIGLVDDERGCVRCRPDRSFQSRMHLPRFQPERIRHAAPGAARERPAVDVSSADEPQ